MLVTRFLSPHQRSPNKKSLESNDNLSNLEVVHRLHFIGNFKLQNTRLSCIRTVSNDNLTTNPPRISAKPHNQFLFLVHHTTGIPHLEVCMHRGPEERFRLQHCQSPAGGVWSCRPGPSPIRDAIPAPQRPPGGWGLDLTPVLHPRATISSSRSASRGLVRAGSVLLLDCSPCSHSC